MVAVVLGLRGDGGALDFDLLISVVVVNLGRLVHPAIPAIYNFNSNCV